MCQVLPRYFSCLLIVQSVHYLCVIVCSLWFCYIQFYSRLFFSSSLRATDVLQIDQLSLIQLWHLDRNQTGKYVRFARSFPAAMMLLEVCISYAPPPQANKHRPRKHGVDWVHALSARDFRRAFRMTRHAFFSLLRLVRNDLETNTTMAEKSSGSPVTPLIKLAATIRWLVRHDTQPSCIHYVVFCCVVFCCVVLCCLSLCFFMFSLPFLCVVLPCVVFCCVFLSFVQTFTKSAKPSPFFLL